MKYVKYSKYFNRIFERILSKNTNGQTKDKNLELAQANISMDYETYTSKAFTKTLISLIISLIFLLIVYNIIPSVLTLVLLILLPIAITFGMWKMLMYLPRFIIKRRERNIDLFLPYAVNFISSMAVAGVSPAEIFQSLSAINMYGEIQKEARKIAKEITIMGMDSITAIKHAIEISPSTKFRSFLQGIIGTIQSGSDLHKYLENVADKYMDEDIVERKKDIDLLSVIVEVFVISVIALIKSSSSGIQIFSRGGQNGIGVLGAHTRFIGALRRSNASSAITAAISDAALPVLASSSIITSLPVFSTESIIVCSSRGTSVRGSITSILMPFSWSFSAAARVR